MLFLITTVSVAAAVIAALYAWRLARRERLRSEARVAALAASDHTAGESTTAETAPMFVRRERSGLQGRPLLKAGVGFAMAVVVIVVIAMSGNRHRTDVQVREVASTAAGGSLELLSMRHSRTGTSLTVTGLVRSTASSGAPVTAIIFVFDRGGGFVASGRAPLEFDVMTEGDESPFRVTIPDVNDIGRYRVSFRTAAGVVPHVDKRPALQVSSAN